MSKKTYNSNAKYRDEEKVDKHPSYGLVSLNRLDNGTGRRLFGSALPSHARTMSLRIYTDVERIHSLGRERYYSPNGPVIEVELSAAQFAELITTMNVGFGVPCTVRYQNGVDPGEAPVVKHETENVRDEFENVFTKAVANLKAEEASLISNIEGKVSKKVIETIKHAFYMATMAVESNAPFYLEQFERATSKITNQAKAEVDAFMAQTIQAAGIKALREGLVTVEETRALGAKKEDDNG